MCGLSPLHHHVHMRRSVLGLTPPQLIPYVICSIRLEFKLCVKAIQGLTLKGFLFPGFQPWKSTDWDVIAGAHNLSSEEQQCPHYETSQQLRRMQ